MENLSKLLDWLERGRSDEGRELVVTPPEETPIAEGDGWRVSVFYGDMSVEIVSPTVEEAARLVLVELSS